MRASTISRPATATRAATSSASSRETTSVEPARLVGASPVASVVNRPGAESYGWAVATWRKADSDCEWMNSSTSSTENVALAVSETCQTMIAPIITGLPLRSLTLISLVSKLRTRTLTIREVASGGTRVSPVVRLVPR